MRKSLILLLIISAKCFGQSSIHFVDSAATWNVAKSYPAGNIQNPDFISTVTKIYGFKGDTLIGSELWNKMFCTTDSAFSLNLIYSGNLREENGIVLFMDTTDNIDTLYNFNLQLGDSVKYNFYGIGSYYIYISNIDSIIIDGNYYKRFFFTEPPIVAFDYLKEVWIEGIGSIHGPVFPANPAKFSEEIPDSMYLTCYKINDTIIWSNPFYNDCYINIVLSLNDFQKTNGNIFTFPNPVNNELRIELPKYTNEDLIISIFDVTGKLILKQNYKLKGQIIIDTRALKNNFYILQIKSADRIYRTKFIKQ